MDIPRQFMVNLPDHPNLALRRHLAQLGAPVDLRRAYKGSKVRNVTTGRILPCCWGDCERDGDDRWKVEAPHPTPRWRDKTTGKQEMLVYIFCCDAHRAMFVKGTPYQKFV